MNLIDKIAVHPDEETTLAQQIKKQIAWLISTNELNPGDILPSVRLLAQHLKININTVRSAYQKLETDGLVKTRQGKGTQVIAFDPQQLATSGDALRSHTIGVILPAISNPFYQTFMEGVEKIARENQLLVFLCSTRDDQGQALLYMRQLAAQQADGIILVSHDIAKMLMMANTRPIVIVDQPGSHGYTVQMELESAGYQATQHLLEHGHRQIGLITPRWDLSNVLPINRGYQRALIDAGIPLQEQLIAQVESFDMQSGAAGARKLLNLQHPPTAIFAAADLLAIGALHEVQINGKRVPEDVAIVGFNNIPLSDLIHPPLTSVAAPAYEMGEKAASLLLALIDGQTPRAREIMLPTTLHIRQSCGHHPPG